MFARTFPYFTPLKRIIPAAHLAVYRATNGRMSSKLAGQHMLLLTTKGRRTGKRRVVPLLYVPDGDDLIVIGSNWGGPAHPLWVRNLLANPEARVQVGPKKRRVTAQVASGPERERLWQLVTSTYAGYNDYAGRVGDAREIPLVVLTPRKAA
ncbi:MAG: nitroreductase family deazaflavin-dependent oxidoreductase [Chloroflexota bacterium]